MEHYFTNNENLRSQIRKINYKRDENSFAFFSDNGVFSKDKIDYGSTFLVDTFLKNNDKKINNLLDVGCGYCFIGITLSKILDCKAEMIDVNKRAIHLANMNIESNKVSASAFESYCYENIKNKYDLIITNPPIRAGKDVVLNILEKAKDYLDKDGELWYVMRKNQGAKSIIKILNKIYKIEIIDKSKGFYVIKAKIH